MTVCKRFQIDACVRVILGIPKSASPCMKQFDTLLGYCIIK